MTTAIVQITPKNALFYKEVRLRALQNSPTAFGSTFAKESQLSDANWVKRAAEWSNGRSIGYLAMDENGAYGIIGAYMDENEPGRAHVVSMWVSPTHRRTGMGRTLMDNIKEWAKINGIHTLLLAVTSSNVGAIDFYKNNGFSMTGNTAPYPNDPGLFEYEMIFENL